MDLVDAHVHLTDFLGRPLDGQDLLTGMDRAGAGHAVVFGLPVRKKWADNEPDRPVYYLDDNAPVYYNSVVDALTADLVLGLAEPQRERLAPTLCGIEPTDQLAVCHLELMDARHPGLFRGVGELLLRHDDLSHLTAGENPRADHPALDPVLELCRARAWPVALHQDAGASGHGHGDEYVPELRRLLERHPHVDVLWCHAGMDRRISPDERVDLVRDLMAQHPRLHVDVSWVLAHVVVDDDGRVDPDWLRLMTDRPDRFVLGSDVFGDVSGQADALAHLRPLLDALPATVAEAVAGGNARRLWWGA